MARAMSRPSRRNSMRTCFGIAIGVRPPFCKWANVWDWIRALWWPEAHSMGVALACAIHAAMTSTAALFNSRSSAGTSARRAPVRARHSMPAPAPTRRALATCNSNPRVALSSSDLAISRSRSSNSSMAPRSTGNDGATFFDQRSCDQNLDVGDGERASSRFPRALGSWAKRFSAP